MALTWIWGSIIEFVNFVQVFYSLQQLSLSIIKFLQHPKPACLFSEYAAYTPCVVGGSSAACVAMIYQEVFPASNMRVVAEKEQENDAVSEQSWLRHG